MRNDIFIIKVPFGGLGDHLFSSHLPRIAKTSGGFKKVFISNLSTWRSLDYKKLVWELNPYVDGFCDDDAPVVPSLSFFNPAEMNILDYTMLSHGLDNGMRFNEPDLWYKPKLIPEISSALVFDPNYISYVGEISRHELNKNVAYFGRVDYQIRARSKCYGERNGVPILDTTDVFHYADIIASCKTFICLTSGGATLAAALGVPAIAFYGYGQDYRFHHSRKLKYVCASNSLSILNYRRKIFIDSVKNKIGKWPLVSYLK